MKIILKDSPIAKVVDKTFILPCTIDIEFVSDVYTLDTLVVSWRLNGVLTDKKIKQGEHIIITDLRAGTLEIVVNLITNNQVVKRWEVPPLTIQEVDNVPRLLNELKRLEERIIALELKHKNIFEEN